MATPMTYDQIIKALKDEGCTVVEYQGSRDRCRCHTGSHAAGGTKVRAWGPINGTMTHITAGGLGTRTVEQYIASIINGDPNVPCKAQFVVAPDGRVFVNSVGRCNHAGTIGSRSLEHAVAGDFPLSGWTGVWRGHDVDGNTHFYGIENIAATSMTAAQRDASVRINAAIARFYGWDGGESVGHGECSDQRGYADPNLNMGKFRADVRDRLVGSAPAPVPAPESTPEPTPTTVTVISASQNFAGNNARGIATASTRIPRYVAARKASPVHVINAQECTVASTVRPRLDSGLKPLGYTRWDGGKGRYDYTRGVRVIAHGLITTPSSTWYQLDDKQASWVVYELDGAIGMDVSLHLESDAGSTADAKRVAQATYIASKALSIAKANGCPAQNVMLAGDTNSEGMVLAALVAAGWRNCADGTEFVNAYTFMGWDGASRKRFDYALVRADAAPAEVVAVSRDTSISDHAGLRIVRQLVK